MVEFSDDPELQGNIKLSGVANEEAKNDHGFRDEADSTQASVAGELPTSTLDEPVVETIVSTFDEIERVQKRDLRRIW